MSIRLAIAALMGASVGCVAATQAYLPPLAEPVAAKQVYTPQVTKSWNAEAKAERDCRLMSGSQFASCLVGSYEETTGYRLASAEYTVKGKTWKVQYSTIKTPKGGKRTSAAILKDKGLPKGLYCKTYTYKVDGYIEKVVCVNGMTRLMTENS